MNYPLKPTDMVAWSGKDQDYVDELKTYVELNSRYNLMHYEKLQKYKIDLQITIGWKEGVIKSKLAIALLRR